MQKSVNTHNRLRYFLTNKILLQVMYRYVRMIFVVKCVTIVHDYCTVQVLYFFIAVLSLEDNAKSQNPLLSYVQERERESTL